MDKFWLLLKQSVIIQAVITLILISTICTMYLTNREVPKELFSLVLLIVGFYFGSKARPIGG